MPPAADAAPAGRLVSLDVFRGLTVAAMILVNNPGSWSHVYPPLQHAAWMGVTPTDLIFPTFLFIAGVAMPFSFAARRARGATRARLARHLLVRCGLLFVIGLALNAVPDGHWRTLRFPGVLQRIAVCVAAAGLGWLALAGPAAAGDSDKRRVRRRCVAIAAVAAVLLAAYWAALAWIPVPGFGAGRLDSLGSLPAYLDRVVFSPAHLWDQGTTPGHGVTYDPEGLLSTMSAVTATLFGLLAGEWLRRPRSEVARTLGLLGVGAALALAGWALSPWLPWNKRIWTSTFALFSGGISLVGFGVVYAIVEWGRVRRGLVPALVLGTNALAAYAASELLADILGHQWAPGSSSMRQWAYERAFGLWLPPDTASLAAAVVFTGLMVLLFAPLYRRRIFLRV